MNELRDCRKVEVFCKPSGLPGAGGWVRLPNGSCGLSKYTPFSCLKMPLFSQDTEKTCPGPPANHGNRGRGCIASKMLGPWSHLLQSRDERVVHASAHTCVCTPVSENVCALHIDRHTPGSPRALGRREIKKNIWEKSKKADVREGWQMFTLGMGGEREGRRRCQGAA